MFKPTRNTRRYSIAVFLILLSLFVVTSISFAAIPRYLSAQARVTNKTTGALLTGSHSVTFRIYAEATGGTALWEEVQAVSINEGILDVALGTTTEFPSTMTFNTEYWVSIEIGSDGEMSPRVRLTGSPFAFNADKIDEVDSTQIVRNDEDGTIAASLVIKGDVTVGDASTDSLTVNAAALSLENAATLDLADDSTGALVIESGLLTLDSYNARIGVGTTAPAAALQIVGGDLYIGSGTPSNASSGPDLFIEGNLDVGGTVYATVSGDSEISSTSATTFTIDYDNTSGTEPASGAGLVIEGGSGDASMLWDVTNNELDINQTVHFSSDAIVAGDMGIGTAAPSATLDVVGTAEFNVTDFEIQTTTDSTTAIQVYDADGGTAILSIDTINERVGIGTEAPDATLDIVGTLGVTGITTLNTVDYTWPEAVPEAGGYALTSTTGGTMSWTDVVTSSGGWTDDNTDVYLTTTTDQVGIGTTDPATALDVQGTIQAGSSNITLTTAAGLLTHEAGGIELDINTIGIGDVLGGASDGTMEIIDGGAAGDGDVLTIQADGTANFEALPAEHDAITVTDSSTVDLTLVGQDIQADGLYTAGDGLTLTTADFDFAATELTDLTWGAAGGSAFTWEFDAGGTDPAITFDVDGNIGIGITDPAYLLEVEGTFDATAITQGGTGVAISGGAFHNGFSDSLAAEHVNWAVSAGTIHTDNYIEDDDTGVAGVYAAGWDGVTDSPQKDALYDYLIQIDTNADGDVDNIDASALSSAGGWTDDNTDVYLTTTTDQVGIGTTDPNAVLNVTLSGTSDFIVDDMSSGNILQLQNAQTTADRADIYVANATTGGITMGDLVVQASDAAAGVLIETQGLAELTDGTVITTDSREALAVTTDISQLGGGSGDADGVLKMGIQEGEWEYIHYDASLASGSGKFVLSAPLLIQGSSPASIEFDDGVTTKTLTYDSTALYPFTFEDNVEVEGDLNVVGASPAALNFGSGTSQISLIYDPLTDAIRFTRGVLAQDFRNRVKNGSFEAFSALEEFHDYDPDYATDSQYATTYDWDASAGYQGGWEHFAPDDWTYESGKVFQQAPVFFETTFDVVDAENYRQDFTEGMSAVRLKDDGTNDGEIFQVITGLKPSSIYSVGVQMRVDDSSTAEVDIIGEDDSTATILSVGIGTTAPIARIEVSDVSNFPDFGTIEIDDERIRYDAVDFDNNYFTKLTRGVDGTTPATHESSPETVTIADFKALTEAGGGAATNFASYKGQFATDANGSDITIKLSSTQANGSVYFDSVQVIAGGIVPDFMPNTIVDTGDQTVYGSLRLGRTSDDKGGILSVDKFVRTRGIELFTDDPGLSGSLGGGVATLENSGIYPPGEGYNSSSYQPATVKLFVSGEYTGTAQNRSYKIQITEDGNPDKFTWWYSDDSTGWTETVGNDSENNKINCAISATQLVGGSGVYVEFSSDTAGTLDDAWWFSASTETAYGGYDSYADTTYVAGKTRIYKEDDPSSTYYNQLVFEDGAIRASLSELAGGVGSQSSISSPSPIGGNSDYLTLHTSGNYSGGTTTNYKVKINNAGSSGVSSARFQWDNNDSNGWRPTDAPAGIAINGGSDQFLELGIYIRFEGGWWDNGFYTGGLNALNDEWSFMASESSTATSSVTSIEGISGAVTMSGTGGIGISTDGQFINISGGSSGWTHAPSAVYTTALSDNVGIGTTNPSAALEVGEASVVATLADGAGDVLISADLEVDDQVQIEGVNADNGSLNALILQGTLGQMDTSDDVFRGIYLDYTNVDHAAGSVNGITIDSISDDPDAGETGMIIGSGWDNQISLMESDGDTYYTSITAGDQDAYIYYTLPIDDGDPGEQLQTDGDGLLTWETAAGAGGTTALSTGTVTATTYAITSDGVVDDIILAAADTNSAGLLSAAKWNEIVANTEKDENVSTDLSVGTVGVNTVAITSDGGADDVTLPAATITTAGMLTTTKWGEIDANTGKATNVPTALSTGTIDATTYGITSDGDTDDIILAAADTNSAGLLSAAKWNEIVANTEKVSTTLTAGTITATTYAITSDGAVDDIVLPAADSNSAGLLSAAKWDEIDTNTGKATNVPTALSTGTIDATTYGITSDGDTDDIILAAADSNSAGLLSAAKWNEIDTNTGKDTNVSTDLSTGTITATTYGITSDGGADDILLAAADTNSAGLLSAAKWNEIVANTEKVSTTLTAGTITATTYGITSDGSADDILLPEADANSAGLLSVTKWGEIVSNTAKAENVSTTLDAGTITATTYGITSDGGADDILLAEADTNSAGLLSAAKFSEIATNTAKTTNASTTLDAGTITATTYGITS
ncbi:beta strand repeat-containing protein, partial [Candidatus Omnitrophota bacterium]